MTGLTVQLPNSLYESLEELATQDGISVDQFIALAKVPNVEPEESDRWPSQKQDN